MTSISAKDILDALNEMRRIRQIRDCTAVNLEGPRCPMCHARAGNPEHGANQRMVEGPGKFEGEREIIRDAYHLFLEGGADADDGETVTVTLTDGTTVSFVEGDMGFVTEVPNPS